MFPNTVMKSFSFTWATLRVSERHVTVPRMLAATAPAAPQRGRGFGPCVGAAGAPHAGSHASPFPPGAASGFHSPAVCSLPGLLPPALPREGCGVIRPGFSAPPPSTALRSSAWRPLRAPARVRASPAGSLERIQTGPATAWP